MQKYYTIVTDLGTELIAQAAQKGQKVNIVHIAAGDGNGAFYNPTSDMTALKREIWRGAILNYEVDALAKNVIKVSGVIPKDVGSFVLREMALFDDKGNMIAICNAPDLLKAVLEEGALTEAVVYMRIAVTNSEAVNITINGSAVFATQEELEAHKSDENAHQKLFDKKVDKTNFTGQKIGEMLTAAGWDSDKTLEALQGLETHKTDPNAHQELFDKKVNNTEFTGTKIGEMLTQIGWSSGSALNNIVDGEKTGSIKQINATVTGVNASAFGTGKALADYAHAEGCISEARGKYAHAEGEATTADGKGAHAEGAAYSNTATSAYADGSHAEGCATMVMLEAKGGHSEGIQTTVCKEASHAEGLSTRTNGKASHAEGCSTETTGNYAHAEGLSTRAKGEASHAEGYGSEATGNYAHAGGMFTIANKNFMTALGTYNKEATDDNDIFVIGSGTSLNTRINCFRVQAFTGVFGCGSYNASGADYAELFEWLDQNPNHDDRAGLFVTLKGNKICIAKPTDSYILGVVSANPSVVGDVHDDQWQGIYLTDIFGRMLYEEIEIQGQKRKVPMLNPEYDSSQNYIPRSARSEWDAIGLLGKLIVIDDGSCRVDDYCTVGDGGIATKSNDNKGYYVMSRLDKNHIQILFR